MVRAFVAIAGVAMAFVIAGCKKGPPSLVQVEGIVRFSDGRPVDKASIRFIPVKYSPDYTAIGVTDEAGHYLLTCKGRPGASPGEYVVVVKEAQVPPADRNPIAKKYSNLIDSPLTADVNASQKEYNFDLESDGPRQ